MGDSVQQPVLLEEFEGVLVITLNRPEVRNAANAALSRAVSRALDGFESDANLHVAILTGAGRSFCAGMDLKAFGDGEFSATGDHNFIGITHRVLAKPVIAAVEGYAVAGGLEAVLACDLVVAARDARFGISEVRRGLAAGAGGLYRLPRKIPINIAMEMALTGEPIDAVRAAQLGLVNHVTEPGDALKLARSIAAMIAANAPLAVRASKHMVVAQQDLTLAQAEQAQRKISESMMASDDAREGAAAFVEKRSARWRGR